ncbi:hypothetical protein HRF69_03205 [Bacillus circulans]|uniref:hypothetical protein n=1 Tax=Niallia circulans TaxID=1397 RepID=UPI001561180C|nr:hypothetical protein [Niallia circulans]NRG26123.1 hypothetical protein [Niallia circulans]
MKEVYAVFKNSNDPDFEEDVKVVKVIDSNVVLDYAENGEWAFRVLDEVITEEHQIIGIDEAKCGHAFISFGGVGKSRITAEMLVNACIIEVIKVLAGK